MINDTEKAQAVRTTCNTFIVSNSYINDSAATESAAPILNLRFCIPIYRETVQSHFRNRYMFKAYLIAHVHSAPIIISKTSRN